MDALANIKLGSGCNFLGYYMFHGGTNPLGKHGAYLNEAQVPKLSYDYQAALGEFGQVRESYSRLKSLHFLTRFLGDRLAPMETVLPEGASSVDPRDTETLRFAVRTDGRGGFLFVNNFQDHRAMPEEAGPGDGSKRRKGAYTISISPSPPRKTPYCPSGFDMDGILLRQANAQPVLRTEINGRATYVFMVPDGMDGAFRFEDGAEIGSAGKAASSRSRRAREVDVLLLSREEAGRLFLLRDGSLVLTDAALLEDADGALRLETTQAENTLRCYPADRLRRKADPRAPVSHRALPLDGAAAAERLDGLKDARLQIDYTGDIGMLFLGNDMISDNFCNGDTWGGAGRGGENLLKNGDFSEIDGDLPEGWRRDMWLTDAGVSLLTVDEDGYEGSCVTVTNVDENDARFAQTVAVEPDTLYRVSGMIRASGCDEDGYGATLSIEDVFVYSDGLYDTDGEWEYVELYGRTGPDQTMLTVFARVGGYGALSRGRASFDDLAVNRVVEAPEGAVVYDFFRRTFPTAATTAMPTPNRPATPRPGCCSPASTPWRWWASPASAAGPPSPWTRRR